MVSRNLRQNHLLEVGYEPKMRTHIQVKVKRHSNDETRSYYQNENLKRVLRGLGVGLETLKT